MPDELQPAAREEKKPKQSKKVAGTKPQSQQPSPSPKKKTTTSSTTYKKYKGEELDRYRDTTYHGAFLLCKKALEEAKNNKVQARIMLTEAMRLVQLEVLPYKEKEQSDGRGAKIDNDGKSPH